MSLTDQLVNLVRTRRRRATTIFVVLTASSFILLIVGLVTGEPLWGAAGMTAGAIAENRRRLVIEKVARLDLAVRLTSRYRMAFRSTLMLLTIAVVTSGDVGVLVATGLLVGCVQIGMAGILLFIRRARRVPIPLLMHDEELSTELAANRAHWYRVHVRTVGTFSAFEAAVFTIVALLLPDDFGAVIGVSLVAAAIIFGATAYIGIKTWHVNSPELRDHQIDTIRETILEYDPEVVIYVVAIPSEFYFVTQWLDAFNHLEKRALWIVRSYPIARRLVDTPWPVLYAPDARSVEAAIGPRTRVAFYVANTGRNVHLVRHAEIKHVFLNHGDSDKASSANPVARMYDEIWVAGKAAADRYAAAGVELRDGTLRMIGRPQVEPLIPGELAPPDDRRIAFAHQIADERTERELRPLDPIEFEPRADPPALRVLYAPTFEGHFAEVNYSSLEVFGPRLVNAILTERPDVGIIFRPHPITGRRREGMREAQDEVARQLKDAPNAHMHTYVAPDSRVALYDNMNDAELLITDVSSLVTDFMATKRPILVSNPRNVGIDEYLSLFPNHRGCYIFGTDEIDFMALLEAALTEDPEQDARAEAEDRLLGAHPEGPMRTFVDAANDLYDHAATLEIANTFRFSAF